jgi:hypothetical protein
MEDGHVMFVSDLSPLSRPLLSDHVVGFCFGVCLSDEQSFLQMYFSVGCCSACLAEWTVAIGSLLTVLGILFLNTLSED